ncbi:MAG: T9SS type A sorting domain-containing protein [Saprospiraceae bacterium]
MRHVQRLLLLAFIGLSCSVSAQSMMDAVRPKGSQEPVNIFELKEAFNAWAQDKNLEDLKGWKPLRRKIYLESMRVDADGFYPDAVEYSESIQEAIEARNAVQARSGGSWWPVGPFGPPPPMGGSRQLGVGRVNCIAFHPTDPAIFYIGAPDGGIWKTTNNGASWTPLGNDLPVPGVSAIWIDPMEPDVIFIATGDSEYPFASTTPNYTGSVGYQRGMGVFKSVDGGATWEPTSLQTNPVVHDLSLLNTIVGYRTDSIYMLMASGPLGIWKSSNGGDTWGKVNLEPTDVLEQDPQNPHIVFASSSNRFHDNTQNKPVIFRSTDFGENWEELPVFNSDETTSKIEIRVAPTDSNVVYALASNSSDSGLYGVYKSEDGGDSWVQKISGDSLNLLGWNAGDPDMDSGGQGWYDLVLCVDPFDAQRLFVGGVNLWGSEDGGDTWSICTHWTAVMGPSSHADLHEMRVHPLTNEFYLSSDGGTIRASDIIIPDWETNILPCVNNNGGFMQQCYDFPTEWENISYGLALSQFYKIDVFNPNDNYLIGGTQDNSHFQFRDTTWYNVFGGDGMDCAYHPTNPDIVVAASQNGNVHISKDGGSSINWNISSEPKDQGASGDWVTPFVGSNVEPFSVFVGFNELWEYEEETDNWNKLSDFPGNQQAREVAISKSNPDAIAVLYTGGTQAARKIFLTKNRGNDWEEITTNLFAFAFGYPSDIAFGNTDDEIYIAFAGYAPNHRVYRTMDGGQTWENITKGLPKIPVISIDFHFNSSNNTVYIGTDYGVFYTSDDLDAWETYSTGLPIVRVADVEVHTPSNKVYIGTYGRGAWANDLVEAPLVDAKVPAIYASAMQVQPNPSNGVASLWIEHLEKGDYSLRIINVLGAVVHEQTIQGGQASQQVAIPAGLTSGMYYIQLTDGTHANTESFIIE